MAAGSEPACVSGALACGLRDVLIDVAGGRVVDAALSRVSREDRHAWLGATPVGWVPIYLLETVFGEVATHLHRDVADLHVEVARISIERTMRTLWRMLLRLTTDHALISRTPIIYAKSYNRGRLIADIRERGRAEVTLTDWPGAPDWPLRATRIGIETALRIAGRREPTVACVRTLHGADYVATWR